MGAMLSGLNAIRGEGCCTCLMLRLLSASVSRCAARNCPQVGTRFEKPMICRLCYQLPLDDVDCTQNITCNVRWVVLMCTASIYCHFTRQHVPDYAATCVRCSTAQNQPISPNATQPKNYALVCVFFPPLPTLSSSKWMQLHPYLRALRYYIRRNSAPWQTP